MRYHGWVFFDALVALTVLGMLTATFALGLESERRALVHLDDSRAAGRSAETALIQLQAGQPPAAGAAVEKLSAAAPDPGHVWARVRTTVNGQSADLVGLVPASDSKPAGGR